MSQEITSSDLDTVLNAPVRQNLAQFHRLLITYRRVVKNRLDGTIPDGSQPAIDRECSIPEFMNLTHPDDSPADPAPNKRASTWNAFREMGEYFRGNANYFDTKYTRYDAVLPA